jgi:hypothetical protein
MGGECGNCEGYATRDIVLVGKRERGRLEDLGIDGRLMMNWSSNWMEESEIDSAGSGEGQVCVCVCVCGSCENGDETLGSIKCEEYLE